LFSKVRSFERFQKSAFSKARSQYMSLKYPGLGQAFKEIVSRD
jgi:hypothetical protein